MASFAPWRRRDSSRRFIQRDARMHAPVFPKESARQAVLLFLCCYLGACHFQHRMSGPSIEFTRIPPAAEGAPDKLDIIEGRVIGGHTKLQLVLYAKTGKWWIQPIVSDPFTVIRPDAAWTNSTHLGTEYAALLVEPGFHPTTTLDEIPKQGGSVVAVARVRGSAAGLGISKTLQFSRYEWRIREAPSSRGGNNNYDPSNAWTDPGGALHLRIARASGDWSCSEVTLTRSLGYGTYSFVVRDTSQLEPAAVFTIFTWDYAGAASSNREMDIEVSRWGDPSIKNAQYVLQPFYVPENTLRFSLPSGVLTHSFRWEPGRVTFRTVRGTHPDGKTPLLAEHVFTSGVPSHGIESVRMNLYVFRGAKEALRNENEVVIEKFEYLP